MDQGACEGCTAHSLSGALKLSAPWLPFIASQRGLYGGARMVARADEVPSGPLPPLVDTGATPNELYRSLGLVGVRAMGPVASDGRFSDCEPATINAEAGLGAFQLGAQHLLAGPYEITETDEQAAAEDAALALSAGFGVTFAVNGEQLENYNPATPLTVCAGAPDHYVYLLGYERTEALGLVFLAANSWGIGFGMGGYFQCSQHFFRDTSDRYVVHVQPLPSQLH